MGDRSPSIAIRFSLRKDLLSMDKFCMIEDKEIHLHNGILFPADVFVLLSLQTDEKCGTSATYCILNGTLCSILQCASRRKYFLQCGRRKDWANGTDLYPWLLPTSTRVPGSILPWHWWTSEICSLCTMMVEFHCKWDHCHLDHHFIFWIKIILSSSILNVDDDFTLNQDNRFTLYFGWIVTLWIFTRHSFESMLLKPMVLCNEDRCDTDKD